MPAPVVPAVFFGASIIQAIVSAVFFLSEYIGARLAIGVVVAAFMVTGWVGLQTLAFATVAGLAMVPSANFQKALSVTMWFIPVQFWAVLSALAVLRIAKWLYQRQWEWVRAVSNVSV